MSESKRNLLMKERIICLLIGYLLGCFMTAEIVVRKLTGRPARELGTSGNPGMANVMANLGFKAGITVLIGDLMKTAAASVVSYLLFGEDIGKMALLYAGLGATLGHDFPFWMKFRGGKGVASSSIAFVIFDPFWGLLANIAGMLVVFATKYLCIGGVVIPVFLGIIYAVFFNNIEALIILIVFAALAFYCHFSKIAGIPSGKTERTDVIGALRRRLNPGKLVLLLLTAIVIVTADAYFFGPLAGLLA